MTVNASGLVRASIASPPRADEAGSRGDLCARRHALYRAKRPKGQGRGFTPCIRSVTKEPSRGEILRARSREFVAHTSRSSRSAGLPESTPRRSALAPSPPGLLAPSAFVPAAEATADQGIDRAVWSRRAARRRAGVSETAMRPRGGPWNMSAGVRTTESRLSGRPARKGPRAHRLVIALTRGASHRRRDADRASVAERDARARRADRDGDFGRAIRRMPATLAGRILKVAKNIRRRCRRSPHDHACSR